MATRKFKLHGGFTLYVQGTALCWKICNLYFPQKWVLEVLMISAYSGKQLCSEPVKGNERRVGSVGFKACYLLNEYSTF